MNPTQSHPTSLHRVVELDERTIARFPPLAVSIDTAATAGEPFGRQRDDLLAALADDLVVHAEFDKATQDPAGGDATLWTLTAAMAAQHRSLAARVEELAHATTGLDAVAITRTIHAILNLTLDLARRILDHHPPAPTLGPSQTPPDLAESKSASGRGPSPAARAGDPSQHGGAGLIADVSGVAQQRRPTRAGRPLHGPPQPC